MRRPRLRLWVFLLLVVSPSSAAAASGLIPFSLLKVEDRGEMEEIFYHPALSRKVIGLRFRSRKEVYEYLLDHPDFATGVARTLRLSKYRIDKDGGSYRAQDYADYEGTKERGMKGRFRVIYSDPAKRIMFVWGTYKKVLTIRARAILVLEYTHQAEEGETYVYSNLYGYVKIGHPILDLVTRLLSPILGAGMDRRMQKTLRLAAKISEEAYRDPAAFLEKLEGSGELHPEQLAEFRHVLCRGC
ncbi:MAG: hypothetical protein ACE5JD_10755 [Candidatus Methylomirabilia bacterium]